MNILLVTSPHLDHSFFHRNTNSTTNRAINIAQKFVPMGLLSIATALHEFTSVKILDINKALNKKFIKLDHNFYNSIVDWLLSYSPDLIGFMTEADSYHHLLRIAEQLKRTSPEILFLMGGPHASAVHYDTIKDIEYVDFILRGEGEKAFVSLVKELSAKSSLSKVGNLTYRQNKNVFVNPDLPLISNLDDLPFPDFSLIELEDEDIIYLEIGRGCPFRCNFCFTAPYWQRKHRIKSSARIIQELKYLKENYSRTDFNFTHDLFTTDRKWVLSFCKALVENKLNITWTCSSRTDTLDEEQIHWLAAAGCRNIYFGIESGSRDMQKKICKNLDLEEAFTIVKSTVNSGIGVTVGFIAGLPGESEYSLRQTLEESFKYLALKDSTVHLFGYHPYVGSNNFSNIEKHLVFNPNFVDFPLPSEVHQENCKFMSSHFKLFTRYSCPNNYNSLNLGLLKAADEFFPLVNALRELLLFLHSRFEIDLFRILNDWSIWIFNKNKQQGENEERLYQGNIEEFLQFLRNFIESELITAPIISEYISWELLKHILRTNSEIIEEIGIQLIPKNKNQDEIYVKNPTVKVDTFRFAYIFLGKNGYTKKRYAFYNKIDGRPQIIQFNILFETILNLSKKPLPLTQIKKVLSCNIEQDISKIDNLFDELIEKQLLIGLNAFELLQSIL